MIGCLEELEDPIGRQASLFIVDFGDDWPTSVVGDETKKAAQPGRRPEPPLMIFQQIMDDAGLMAALSTTPNATVCPTTSSMTCWKIIRGGFGRRPGLAAFFVSSPTRLVGQSSPKSTINRKACRPIGSSNSSRHPITNFGLPLMSA